jgi:hypothetical protein
MFVPLEGVVASKSSVVTVRKACAALESQAIDDLKQELKLKPIKADRVKHASKKDGTDPSLVWLRDTLYAGWLGNYVNGTRLEVVAVCKDSVGGAIYLGGYLDSVHHCHDKVGCTVLEVELPTYVYCDPNNLLDWPLTASYVSSGGNSSQSCPTWHALQDAITRNHQ